METHFTEELGQLQDGVGDRGEAEGQHAGNADQVILGQAHRPAINPGHGDSLADGDPFAEDLRRPPGFLGKHRGFF